MYITPQGPCLRNDLYCVEWDVKLYYTIPLLLIMIRLLLDTLLYGMTTNVDRNRDVM